MFSLKRAIILTIPFILISKIAMSYHVERNDTPNLSTLQKHVIFDNGTERAFDNAYWNNKKEGIYVDVLNGEPLFSSHNKYVSGTGWPSFTKPIHQGAIESKVDHLFGMTRTEIRAKDADIHLGHVFDDGPQDQGGKRYCINSAALRFIAKEDLKTEGLERYADLFDAS